METAAIKQAVRGEQDAGRGKRSYRPTPIITFGDGYPQHYCELGRLIPASRGVTQADLNSWLQERDVASDGFFLLLAPRGCEDALFKALQTQAAAWLTY